MGARVFNSHVYQVSAETYWRETMLNIPFLTRLYTEQLGLRSIALVEQHGDYERGIQRVLRMFKPIAAPGPVKKVLGDVMTIDEHSTFDPGTQTWTYRMAFSRLADRLFVRGSISLKPCERGVEETSDDELDFKMFGVSGLVESFMVRETKQSHLDRTMFTQRYIQEHQLK
ncbi:MAG: DUF2505 family protein [Polyangiales bacterium]